MRQVLRAGALGRPRGDGMGREKGGGMGMSNACKSMADSCQCMAKKHYNIVISLQLIKINEKINKQSAALNMPANWENSAVATGLEKVSFHSNPKERQCQKMFKVLHNRTHLKC